MSDTSIVELILRGRDETAGAFSSLRGQLEGMHSSISRIKDIALGNIVGNMALEGMSKLTEGIVDFGKGLITANADAESMHQTLQALYGTKTEADQAFNWMTKFALQAPFTRSSIIQAGVAIASFGGDITKVLPALGNVAAIMGTDMPTAAQAFNDALAGRFQMMNRDLHISKEALVEFGLEMNKSGHVTSVQSFVNAFEKLAATRFGTGMSLQMQTFNGQMSNLEDQFQNLQRTMGAGLFEAVKGQLFGLITFFNTHQQQVTQFAHVVGQSMANAAGAVIDFGRWVGPWLGTAILVGMEAWHILATVVGAAIGFVQQVIHGFVAWFGSNVAPTIYTVIGTIAGWWQIHANQVHQAVTYIWDRVREWVNLLVTGMRMGWNFIAADVKMLWDVIQGVWSIGSDLLSGNWSQLKDDLIATGRTLAADLVKLIGMAVSDMNEIFIDIPVFMAHAFIAVIPLLAGPLNGIISAFNDFVTKFKTPIGVLAGILAMAFTPLVDAAKLAMNGVMSAVQAVVDKIPTRINLPFGKHVDLPGISSFRSMVDSYKSQPLEDPRHAFTGAYDAVQKFQGVGGGKPLDFTAIAKDMGVGVDKVASVLKQYGVTGVKDMMDAIANWMDPNSGGGEKTKTNAQKLGKEIIDNLFGGFKGLGGGLGGGLTLDGFLKKMGFDFGGAPSIGALPGPGGLPVAGFGTPADTGAASGGGAASYTFPTIAQNLGALAASFGGTRVTPGGGGSEQEKERQMQRQIAELTKANASLQAQLAQRTTEENLLRSLYHVGDLSRGSLEALAQKLIPLPQPRVSLHRAIGPV